MQGHPGLHRYAALFGGNCLLSQMLITFTTPAPEVYHAALAAKNEGGEASNQPSELPRAQQGTGDQYMGQSANLGRLDMILTLITHLVLTSLSSVRW